MGLLLLLLLLLLVTGTLRAGDQVSGRYSSGPGGCESNTYNGQTIGVYSSDNLKGSNNEITW